MKVRVAVNIDVTDTQRVQLARLLDGPDAKKRQATRDEIKDFAWQYGAVWDQHLDALSDVGTEEDLVGQPTACCGPGQACSRTDCTGTPMPSTPEIEDDLI